VRFRLSILLLLFSISTNTGLLFAEEEVLKVGISSMITPVDTVKYYDDIVNYIGKKLGSKVLLVHKKKYEEMNKLVEKGEIDIAFICTAAFVHLKENARVELVAAPVKDDKPFYKSYIIVHRDSGINNFSQLRGKSFVFADPLSNTGYLYPLYKLSKMKERPDTFFSKTMFSYSHNKSIEMVAKKLADGAAVENLVFNYMKETNSPYVSQVKIIEESMDFASPPIIMRSSLPKGLREKVKNIILNMHNDSEGRDILANMKIKKFAEVFDRDYDLVKQMRGVVEKSFQSMRKNAKRNQLVFGVPDIKNPRILYEKYQPLVDYLSSKSGMDIQLVIKDHKELRRSLINGEIDIGIIGFLDFVNVNGNGIIDVLGIPKNKENKSSYKVAFITKSDKIKSLVDLQGKRVGFGPVRSDELNLIPRLMLAQQGIHLAELGKYKHYGYEDTILKALLRDEIDAGVIRDIHREKIERLGFKIIEMSKDVHYGPLVIRKDLDPELKNKLKTLIFNIPLEVLARLDYDLQGGFDKVDISIYNFLEKSYKKIPTGCGIRCHPRTSI